MDWSSARYKSRKSLSTTLSSLPLSTPTSAGAGHFASFVFTSLFHRTLTLTHRSPARPLRPNEFASQHALHHRLLRRRIRNRSRATALARPVYDRSQYAPRGHDADVTFDPRGSHDPLENLWERDRHEALVSRSGLQPPEPQWPPESAPPPVPPPKDVDLSSPDESSQTQSSPPEPYLPDYIDESYQPSPPPRQRPEQKVPERTVPKGPRPPAQQIPSGGSAGPPPPPNSPMNNPPSLGSPASDADSEMGEEDAMSPSESAFGENGPSTPLGTPGPEDEARPNGRRPAPPPGSPLVNGVGPLPNGSGSNGSNGAGPHPNGSGPTNGANGSGSRPPNGLRRRSEMHEVLARMILDALD
ncbi:uncharacterized protein C8Q71DRAFT_853457 [Rhodofomes roseus]|uniref:Uncharacterized protein n=1 Tax=Rhodofomes roseus TaxID=34475 RepID=A0ABQ8KV84_9APHY|nr:uncharacterized protein C8Q71DRAFT_853457 [Rhodofomes roseus]KAH9842944.1 hypothetical protein C8Q71DRAFT_853457 [Rhodofomes roseus]